MCKSQQSTVKNTIIVLQCYKTLLMLKINHANKQKKYFKMSDLLICYAVPRAYLILRLIMKVLKKGIFHFSLDDLAIVNLCNEASENRYYSPLLRFHAA
jgi:hypothetical protein